MMTNFGLERALGERAIPFERAPVGDRYVLEKLYEVDWQLGGENSGHILCLDKHTTGDGIVSALQVLTPCARAVSRSINSAAGLQLYPQVLVNVKIERGQDVGSDPRVQSAVRDAEAQLADKGESCCVRPAPSR